jgi:hypothetical protein
MKRIAALACVTLLAGAIVVARTHETTAARAPALPAPTRIDAEFEPRFHVTAISWDDPAPGQAGHSYRYRYRRAEGRWSTWQTTTFGGIDLHRSHEHEAIDVEVRTRDSEGDLSAATRVRVVGLIPPTFGCEPHPYGAYPSTCVAGATPPMGD